MATFGEILSELRHDRHLTQREFANTIHVSVSTISNYEQGIHFPDIDKLIEIADYFQVTTDYLLGRCQYNISPDAFSELLSSGKTVGEFIRDARQLPKNRKEALALILNDMAFHATVLRYNKKDADIE